MTKQEIGRFYATSFNEEVALEFIVFDDDTIDCPTLGLYEYKYISLKPRFHLGGYKKDVDGNYYDIKSYTYDVKSKDKYQSPMELIGKYNIDEDLFYYLDQKEMIRYSTDMAYLYDLPDKSAYDQGRNKYGVGSPYKWAKKKGHILVKQRKGQFN